MQFDDFFHDLASTPLSSQTEAFRQALREAFDPADYGDLPGWMQTLASIPKLHPSQVELDRDTLLIGRPEDATDEQLAQLEAGLRGLIPWRKGPYDLFGVHIDTEWRSDWKWQRVAPHLSPLQNRLVLDVGCGSGYHCWRIRGAGARFVLGVDPSPRFLVQFAAVKGFVPEQPVHFLPLRSEDIPPNLAAFDTVFSMGVLYHRRSPFDHLEELKAALAPGGELVLETLVIEGNGQQLLLPDDRYAQMRNVWFIPSPDMLVTMVKRMGFQDVRIVDLNRTSLEEQRSTEWMRFHSLKEFLDPQDPSKTLEGYPAPVRAVVIARKPGRP